ncbi:MAG: peptidylprolyl isomerase [Candidatus Omnitrophica bacterium]|nr:peptidylprolyl isomerase [Candidatus Omnitrophota bacterium]
MRKATLFERFFGVFSLGVLCQICLLGVPSAFGQGAPEPAAATAEASSWPETAPDVFKVKLECSHGDIILEVHKDWAPIGVEHFYELAKMGFYDGARFFRVVPGFMSQFGISGDPEMTRKYGEKNIKDDPVKLSNTPGMVTYAKTMAPNSRSTQLFINTGNNTFLDGQGFAPFARVVEGLDVVKKINSEYGEKPNQMKIRTEGNEYLNKAFPNLDYIEKVTFVE